MFIRGNTATGPDLNMTTSSGAYAFENVTVEHGASLVIKAQRSRDNNCGQGKPWRIEWVQRPEQQPRMVRARRRDYISTCWQSSYISTMPTGPAHRSQSIRAVHQEAPPPRSQLASHHWRLEVTRKAPSVVLPHSQLCTPSSLQGALIREVVFYLTSTTFGAMGMVGKVSVGSSSLAYGGRWTGSWGPYVYRGRPVRA